MTRRRRNVKDLLTPDPTPDRQLTHPSGWCMTNDHDDCRYQFSHGKCGCNCHIVPALAKKQERPKSIETINTKTIIVDVAAEPADPRPWKR